MLKRILTVAFFVAAAALSTSDIFAYRVTGTFKYTDREQDETGFTGNEPLLPVRGADVEVYDRFSYEVLATAITNVSGEIDINVDDNQIRDIQVRALTTTEHNPFLNVRTETWEDFGSGDPYALESDIYYSHDPSSDLDIGTVIAEPLGLGGPFNIFDCQVNQMMFVYAMTGDNPGGYHLMTARFTQDENPGQDYYSNGILYIGAESPYDDCIVMHMGGHFIQQYWSADDNPGGIHYIGDVNQDPRLSYGEGIAAFWEVCTRAFLHLNPAAHLTIATTGAPGPGHLAWYVDYEEPNWGSYGPACEVAVTAVLYDILDNADWEDFEPGVEEDFDELSLPFYMTWHIADEYIEDPVYAPRTIEDFWDAWMTAYGDTARYEEMQVLFDSHVMEYWEDEFEPDDTKEEATFISWNGEAEHHTLYAVDDIDWFYMQGSAGKAFRVTTHKVQPATYTYIRVYESNGYIAIADNLDDVSEPVEFVTDTNDIYYITVNQHSMEGIYTEYGAYDIQLEMLPPIYRVPIPRW